MDKSYVKSTLEGLKSSSSGRIQESLLKIRSKIIVHDNGIRLFRECDGFEYLLPHLRKPNERILDLTLSILGNCCLEEESSLTVGKLNTFGPLVSILKTVCRDSIVGRACRVIGNLAQKNSNAEGLHGHGAVSALVTLIENREKTTSYPTLTMAVRAIRQLWMLNEKREEMLSLNAVRCIAILLTAECESANILKSVGVVKENDRMTKSQEELISGILKCIGYFTTHATVQCAEQIQGDGRGYQCLVALTKLHETTALKCLMNLCYLSSCRPLLGIAGLVECIVGILQKISDVSWWPEGAARALAQLSGESVNRSRLRHCGGLPLLVAAARVSPDAIHALLQYVFDDTSFQVLVNEGLISLLTEELIKHVTTMDYEHNNLSSTEIKDKTDSKEKQDSLTKANINQGAEQSSTKIISKRNLFVSCKSQFASKNEEDLNVVIERDNMIVGFVDAIDSDASDESQTEHDNLLQRRKRLKRARSGSPNTTNKKSQFIRMASQDWSAGVYWEPKSPECPTFQLNCSLLSPDRDQNMHSPYSDGNQSGFSPEYRGNSKRPKWDWSPESGVSTGDGNSTSPYWTEYQWSPGSSGSPTSPFSNYDESSDSEMSGRYSPVCSEPEGDAEVATVDPTVNSCSAVDLAAANVAHELDDLLMEDDESADEEGHSEENLSKTDARITTSRVACVLVLLFRVSHGACSSYNTIKDEPVANSALELLTRSECLNALLDYVERCKRPLGRAARILTRVLSNALCLTSILKHRIVLRLHQMSMKSIHSPTECQQCKQIVRLSTKLLGEITKLAESSYGIGEICYQLLKGNSAMKQTLTLTLPYIVRTERPLKKYFIECNALNSLFTIIAEAKEDLQDSVTALSKLALNVHIKDPKTLENRFKDKECVDYDPILDNLSVDDVVTFELDDMSTVQVNKIFLCQNSEVFSAMLMGHFRESVETCVKLKKVTKPALEYLLTLLHCGLENTKCNIQVFPLAKELEINLEVLLLADRFLFEKLKGLLSSAILQFQMGPDTADKIYTWSLSEGMGFLCVESIAYLLTGKMGDLERTRSFSNIFNLEYKEQCLDDIKTMILRQLVKK